MSRKSYGAELFSPLRSDSSLDEVSITSRESDVFNELFQDIKKDDNKKIKKRSNSKKSLKLFADDLTSAVKSSQSLFSEVDPKASSKENSINRSSFITTRRKNVSGSHIASRDDSFKIPTSTVNASRCSIKDTSIDLNKKNTSRIKQSSSRHLSLPSVAEEPIAKQNSATIIISEAESLKPSSSGPQGKENYTLEPVHVNFQPEPYRDVTPATVAISNPDNLEPSPNSLQDKQDNATEPVLLEYHADAYSNVVQGIASNSNLPKPDPNLFFSTKKSYENEKASQTTEASVQTYPMPTKALCENCGSVNSIEASLMESIVKQVVSSEMDGVRQMLYLQQLSLMKHTSKHFMAINDNVTESGVFVKIIEGLLEENRQLKNIIANAKM